MDNGYEVMLKLRIYDFPRLNTLCVSNTQHTMTFLRSLDIIKMFALSNTVIYPCSMQVETSSFSSFNLPATVCTLPLLP